MSDSGDSGGSPEKGPRNGKVILVVDDEIGVRTLVRDALERSGYMVVEAADGNEALQLMRIFNRLPDLVITDLVMPKITGQQLVEALRIEGALPRLLLMSGYDDADLPPGARPERSPFIKKPFSYQELVAKVEEALRS